MRYSLTPRRTFVAFLVLAALAGPVACGDDDEEDSGAGATTQEQGGASADSEAAQQLEAYLKKNTGDIKSSHTKTGEVMSHVEEVDGQLKIWTFLSTDETTDDKQARQICRVALDSGIPEAEGSVVVDGGGFEFFPCKS